jgi:hypothetical protein
MYLFAENRLKNNKFLCHQKISIPISAVKDIEVLLCIAQIL